MVEQAPEARIELLLRVMNYLAAPFGTKEWELVNHGVEGTHFTRGTDGGPAITKLAAEGGDGPATLPVTFIASAPQPLYMSGNRRIARQGVRGRPVARSRTNPLGPSPDPPRRAQRSRARACRPGGTAIPARPQTAVPSGSVVMRATWSAR